MHRRRGRRSARPWYLYLLGAVTIAFIALGVSELGTPTSSARTSTEVVTAESGVVQSTVSGSGNVEPNVDQAVNFATSGTLKTINVKVGQHVKKGQLIATLDPTAAQLTLSEAEDSLTAAEDELTSAEEGGSGSGSSGSGNSGGGENASAASVSDTEAAAAAVYVDLRSYTGGSTSTSTTTTPTTTSTTTSTTTTTTPTTTSTTPTTTTTTTTTTRPTRTTTTPTRTTTTPARTTPTRTTPASGNAGTAGQSKKGATTTGSDTGSSGTGARVRTTTTPTTTTTKSTPSPSAIAQAQASVDSAEATVTNDKKALAETKLYAPVSGTIAALSDTEIGQTISSGGSGSGGSGSSGSGASGLAAASSSSSTSSSSSGFATIINSKTMTMTVSLSESDISSVKVGQLATISLSALSGVELGAHVTSISPLGTSSSGVVTYNVTLTTDQSNAKVLPGMSATATIVVSQQQGVTVPNQAISGAGSEGTVQLDSGGKITSQPVVVGLRGSSRSVILSGLKAGQEVQITITLPALGTSTTSTSSSSTSPFGSGGFGGRFGGTGGFGGGGGGGIRAFFSGGG